MEKLKLSSPLIEITNDREIFKIIHKNSYDIITISDFLKLPKRVVESEQTGNLLFNLIKELENNSFKMDYELTKEELNKRNKMRDDIEKEMQEKRKSIYLDEILDKEISKISELRTPSKAKKILSENGIIKISDILVLDYYVLCGTEKGCLKLPCPFVKGLLSYLHKIGLELAMINPFTLEANHREDFKQKTDEQVDKELVSIKEPNKEISTKKEMDEQKKELQEKWKKIWYRKYGFVKLFHHYHHHILIPKGYKCDGIDLGDWIGTQKKKYFTGSLKREEIEALENLNIIWRSQRTTEGAKRRKIILSDNSIRFIKFKEGNVITTYKDGTEISTNNHDYLEDIERLLNGENVDKIINERLESTKAREDIQTLDKATGYIEKFKLMKEEEEELRNQVENLKHRLEIAKSKLYEEYEQKYIEMCELYQVGIQIDIALEKNIEEENIHEKFSEYNIPSVEDSKKLTTNELIQKIEFMKQVIEGINQFIKLSLVELEERKRERELELQKLKNLKRELEKELNQFQNGKIIIK